MSYTVTTKPNRSQYDCSADFANTAFDKGYSYLIRKNGDNYEAVSGATGRLVYGGSDDEGGVDGSDDAAVIAAVLAAVSSGVVLLNGVAFDLTQFGDIPEDVQVHCSYNAEYHVYINSADSSGSPYTFSVGSGVNVGYYLAADSEGRICFTSTNISSIFNSVAQNNTVIYLNPLSAELLNSITISHKANITIEADRASLLWSTMDDAFIEITQSSNINIRGLWLKGDADGAKHEQRGIQMFDHCSNILIENNQVENMGYDGILALYTVNNLKILNNDVIGCQDDGINPGGGGGNEEGIGQTVVSGNYIANSGSDGLHLSDRSRQTIATNNFIVNCNYGISIYNSSYNIISNNIITGCRYGIGTVFGLCPGLTISDNLINETTVGAGISLNGHGAHFSSVTGNKILYPAAYGIDIGASNNINIDDNTIKGGTRAIYISAYLVTVTNNNIWAPTNYGIVVSGVGTGNCTVIGNLIEYGCASGAIYISSSFNTVSQNILRTVGAGIIEPTTYGADYNIFSQCSSDKPIMLTGEHTSISQSWNGTTLINYMVGGVEKLP